MKNVLRVLKRDFLRILKAPASIVVVLALIVLPSLYTWFNVVGFWNPYGNTGNLRVCVVNEDAGSSSDLTGAINLGDMVVEQLHDNDQLGWDFVDYDTAMEAVKSGHAYAAFVLPRDFSADLLTLLSGDFQQPQLEYYVNEKMNPVSPKITDTGANTLDTTINSTFVATVAKTVTDALGEEVGVAQGKIDDAHTNALAGVDKAQQSISGARDSVQGLRDAADQSQTKVADAASLLSDADEVLGDLSGQMLIVQSLMGTTQTDVSKLTSGLMGAMDSGSIFLSQSAAKVNTAIGGAAGSVTEAQGRVDGAIAQGNAMVSASQAVVAQMEALVAQMDDNDPNKASLEKAIERLKQSNTNASQSLSELSDMSADMGRVAESVSSASDSVNTAVQTTISNADSYRGTLSSDTFPAINAGVGNLNVAVGNLAAAASAQRVLVDQAISLTGQLSETLATARSALDQTDGVLADLQTSIDTVKTDLVALKTSTAITDFFGDGTTIDAEKVASFMQSPTEVKTEYLFPLNAYGSGMAPLFINMSLWIGVFMLMVIMRIEVDDEGIENLTAAQRYIARYLFFGGMVSLQAIVCCVGCLAIGVQCESVALFLLTAVLASLTYLAIQLTLSTTLQHIGKGICVILIFVQIPGATGLYPIEMTSPFFQFIYPFFPFTYGINALRENLLRDLPGDRAGTEAVLFESHPYVRARDRAFRYHQRRRGAPARAPFPRRPARARAFRPRGFPPPYRRPCRAVHLLVSAPEARRAHRRHRGAGGHRRRVCGDSDGKGRRLDAVARVARARAHVPGGGRVHPRQYRASGVVERHDRRRGPHVVRGAQGVHAAYHGGRVRRRGFDAELCDCLFADERARREGQRQARCAYGRAALAREQGGRRQACPRQDGSWGRCGRWEVGGRESGESEGCRRRCERDERGCRRCC